ncbi:4294_t:CDS:2, partial [Entrophospora sp. SA101]
AAQLQSQPTLEQQTVQLQQAFKQQQAFNQFLQQTQQVPLGSSNQARRPQINQQQLLQYQQFVLGVVFLAGSWPRKKSKRESMNAHLSTQLFVSTSASTLALAVLALVTPAAFKIAAPVGTGIECDLQNITSPRTNSGKIIKAGEIYRCSNCGARETPAWRRDLQGEALLCNAFKGRQRPTEVDTDGEIRLIKPEKAGTGPPSCQNCGTQETPCWRGSEGSKLYSRDSGEGKLAVVKICLKLQTNHINEKNDHSNIGHDPEDASRDIHIHTPNILKKPKIVSKDPVKWYRNTREILLAVKSNFLLIFLPPAIIMKRFDVNDNILLFFNFLAIIPLSKIMTTGIDDLSARFHPSYGAILHAFAGNFVELVISCYALLDKQYSIVRSSVLGAILCNILLSKRESMNAHLSTQLFVSTSASTLALAVLALVTPAAFKIAAPVGTGIECDLQNISHAIAIILLFVYAALLIFQLKTHVTSTISMDEVHYREAKYFLLFDVFL